MNVKVMIQLLCSCRPTAFTCRTSCKERDVSKNRDVGPFKCNDLFGGDHHGQVALMTTRYFPTGNVVGNGAVTAL